MNKRILIIFFVVCGLLGGQIQKSQANNFQDIIYYNNFDNLPPVRNYNVTLLNRDWNNPIWNDGITEGNRVQIVNGQEAFTGNSLRIYYPKGVFGPKASGAQWILELGQSYNELFCSYRIKFSQDFDFSVQGGKLPGFAGGVANTGGKKPNGQDGWSARMMWHHGGRISQYLYYLDQASQYGDAKYWESGNARFIPGKWHLVQTRIVINSLGQTDGIIQSWLDEKLVLNLTNIRLRNISPLRIDKFYFSTFFGGNDSSWAPKRDVYIYFDNFVISTKRIGSIPTKYTQK